MYPSPNFPESMNMLGYMAKGNQRCCYRSDFGIEEYPALPQVP